MRIKRNRKLMSILLTLAMLVTLLVPMVGPAAASTTLATDTVPNVTHASGSGYLAMIKIDGISLPSGSTDQIQVTLPSGVSFANTTLFTPGNATVTTMTDPVSGGTDYVSPSAFVNGSAKIYTPTSVPNTTVVNGVYVQHLDVYNSSMLAFTIATSGSGNAGSARIYLPYNYAAANSGNIKVNIQDTAAAVTTGQLVIGNVVTGGTTNTVTSTASVAQNGTDHVTFTITENSAGALVDANEFHIDLPSHFTWSFGASNGTTDSVSLAGGYTTAEGAVAGSTGTVSATNAPITISVGQNSSGNSRLSFVPVAANHGTTSSMPGTIQVTATITADNSAPSGDVIAAFGGSNQGFTASTATVGTCGNYTLSGTSSSLNNVFAGQNGQTIANFDLKESIGKTLIDGRVLSVSLPGGAKWTAGNLPIPVVNSGSVVLGSGTLSSDQQTVNYGITNTGNNASDITFTQGEVNVDPSTATGTLTAVCSGSGQTVNVDIAKIVSPVTATASATPDVQLGSASQSVGDVTITEQAAGALMATPSIPTSSTTTSGNGVGYLDIIAPNGITFDGAPTVKVTSGDINLSASGFTLMGQNGGVNNLLRLQISNGSSKASTLSVTGIKLNLDNTVPAGSVKLYLGGTGLINVYGYYNNGAYVTSVPVANCASSITKTSGGTATFTIGSTDFTMNGAKQTMDAAPYLKNDRTYLPIRFVAQAVGVPDSNIIWNSDDQSVTLIKGGTVVKLVIGSTTMTINGTSITMDTAPEIVDPGRTMLPVSWVAKALGCQINWDAATQTVTVQG